MVVYAFSASDMLFFAVSHVLTLKNINIPERVTSTTISIPITFDLSDCVMLYHITAGMPPLIPSPFFNLYGIFVFFLPPFIAKHNTEDIQRIRRSIPV
jgi:hypothetical protein